MATRQYLIALAILGCSQEPVVSDAGTGDLVSADTASEGDIDRGEDFDSAVSSTQEFPQANDGIANLRYRAAHGVEPCVEAEFVGEIAVADRTLTAWVGEGAPATDTRELTENEVAQLQDLIVAVPPVDLQMPHNCDPCLVRSLRVDGHEVAGECCGVCNPEFGPAFDAVAAFLVALVPR